METARYFDIIATFATVVYLPEKPGLSSLVLPGIQGGIAATMVSHP